LLSTLSVGREESQETTENYNPIPIIEKLEDQGWHEIGMAELKEEGPKSEILNAEDKNSTLHEAAPEDRPYVSAVNNTYIVGLEWDKFLGPNYAKQADDFKYFSVFKGLWQTRKPVWD